MRYTLTLSSDTGEVIEQWIVGIQDRINLDGYDLRKQMARAALLDEIHAAMSRRPGNQSEATHAAL